MIKSPSGRNGSLCAEAVSLGYFFLLSLALFPSPSSFAEAIKLDEVSIDQLELDPAVQLYVAVEYTSPGIGDVELDELEFKVEDDDGTEGSEIENQPDATYIDIVLLKLSENDCYTSEVGQVCDWAAMGIGRQRENSTATWFCCTPQAQESGICQHKERGRLLIDHDMLAGQSLNVSVPTDLSSSSLTMPDPFAFGFDDPGNYTIVMANCDIEFGRKVIVNGPTIWVSVAGDIQLFISESVPFFAVMTVLYAALCIWYGWLMKQNRESRIRLEEWIILLIVLGLGDVTFHFFQYLDEEHNESLRNSLLAFGAIIGAVKHGLSRGLLQMLALGWGVVHATLDSTPQAITLILTVAFCALRAGADILARTTLAKDNDSVDQIIATCFWATIAIDFIFLVWIPSALLQTIKHLKETGQTRKLERYRTLLRILGLAVFLTILLVALIIFDFVTDGGQEINVLNVTQGNEVNFFVILLFVAIVWKPNPMAREFVYVVELSSEEDGGPDGIMADLELTENTSRSTEYNHFPKVQEGESA